MLRRLLKEEIEKKKKEKISNVEYFKERVLRSKNCGHSCKKVHALVDWNIRVKFLR